MARLTFVRDSRPGKLFGFSFGSTHCRLILPNMNNRNTFRVCLLCFFVLLQGGYLGAKPSEYLSDSLARELKTAGTAEQGPLLISICNGYYDTQPDKAKQYARQLIALGEKTGNTTWVIKGYYGLALADYYHSVLPEAYRNFEQSYRLSKEAGNDSTAMPALNSMAVIHARLGRYDKAGELFREIGKLARKNGQQQVYVTSLMNLGNCFHEQSNIDSALFYYNSAYRLAQQYGLILSAVSFGINMSELEKERGNNAMARQYILEALDLARSSNNTGQVLACLSGLSGIELKMKHFAEAENYAFEALKLAEGTGAKDEIMASYYALYRSKEEQHKADEALSYFKKYTAIKDSILNNEVQTQILELSARYENEKNENTILAQEKHLKQARQRLVFLFMLTGFLLGVILLGGLVYHKRNQMLQQLLAKNLEAMEAERSGGGIVPMTCFREPLNRKKYSNSSLAASSKEFLELELNRLFTEQKPWRQPDISLDKIANLLDTNTKYLSQIINQTHGNSFPNFINELRIKEARCMLIDRAYAHYTIEAIGKMTGFNSNSSFVNAFKRYTGFTPSFFRNSQKKQAGTTSFYNIPNSID